MASKKDAEQDFEALLEKYDYNFQKGDLVKGVICGFDSQGVMVDIGAKTYAVIPTYEAVEKGENIEEKFNKGDEGEFLIIRNVLISHMHGKNLKKQKLLMRQFSVLS